jgi:hypothetical protein
MNKVKSQLNIGKALTWDELADIYDKEKRGGRRARTLPMEHVFNWAKAQEDRFYVDPIEGTLHLIEQGE